MVAAGPVVVLMAGWAGGWVRMVMWCMRELRADEGDDALAPAAAGQAHTHRQTSAGLKYCLQFLHNFVSGPPCAGGPSAEAAAACGGWNPRGSLAAAQAGEPGGRKVDGVGGRRLLALAGTI